jgi:negative regulator of sigma E activity
MNVGDVMLSKINQAHKNKQYTISLTYESKSKVGLIEVEHRMVISRGWG